MDPTALIKKFYTAFSEGDAATMTSCYHTDIVFQDPVFGKLNGARACTMWKMLLSQKKAETSISFSNIDTNSHDGTANWIAKYQYGDKNRPVVNHVQAQFKFKDGKIISHTDTFDLWKWTRQALGISGYLIGWTPFMKKKIQATTNQKLDAFIENSST